MSPETSRRWQWLVIAVVVGFVVWLLSPVLMPFAIAAMLAYLCDPLADRLERWKLNRTLAVSIVFAIMVLVVVGVLLMLIPLIQRQVVHLIESLPSYVTWVKQVAMPWLQVHLHLEPGSFNTERIMDALRSHIGSVSSVVAATLAKVSKSGFGIIMWLTNLVLIPVVTFYLLRDWDRMVGKLDQLLPRRQRPTIVHLARESNQVLGAFVRGQLLVMVSLGIIYGVGLSLIGLNVGPLIGMVAGLLSFVPYLGFIIGLVAAVVAVLVQFGDWFHLGMLAIVFAIGQTMEGYVLTPKLVGDKIGLHPVAVIFAVLAGGQLFGFLGVLLALPAAAVIMVLVRYGYKRYQGSDLYDDRQKVVAVGNDDAPPGDEPLSKNPE
ncbi:MAG TPA: AI-2E family transporter [Oleiagrimonas sp.]|nr:AI-2E family transporter [Oleiagrimonas sp.]